MSLTMTDVGAFLSLGEQYEVIGRNGTVWQRAETQGTSLLAPYLI